MIFSKYYLNLWLTSIKPLSSNSCLKATLFIATYQTELGQNVLFADRWLYFLLGKDKYAITSPRAANTEPEKNAAPGK
jgi:hypothetical protein